ncbi:MAG: aspartate--tRNA(Asn) ligase [Candidatus Altiarchaeota archaeon]|nr:aspartate--tRNA(Asn) ligase [Candidatus Altiarchaeota archaeon]MBU4341178.1 aspartate--tRNA(Asn) ligase [Candidatus Altiarchaeota archaeon]MBU4406099.1 aspartate--tRNA(Asn) ligase [Candidatus Altiarchaeota archaeon]MBU4437524.1 aspartate--tRNA(Asn) ligase [Candidatus Altiarchaeota archaeon]
MRTHYSIEITQGMDGKDVTLAGWVHELRDLGKLKFIVLRDREGFIQITAKKGDTDEKVLELVDSLSRESVIEVNGKVKGNDRAPGGIEISPSGIEVLSKADSPLPLDVTQKVDADMDTRLNNRFMDLRKPQVSAIFRLRSKIMRAGREFLTNENFIEITSPKIISSASEGGTDLFPISYFDREAFLAQSPQLYKQMMMATGFDRIFEITTYFRAEEHDTRRHLNEISAFDLEMAFIKDEEDVMNALEGLVLAMIREASLCEKELSILKKEVTVPESPVRRIGYDEALELLGKEGKEIPWGEDLDTASEKLLGEIMRRDGTELYFIKGYPLDMKPFYTMPRDEKYSRSFDLGYRGVEISSGGQRVHDYKLLSERLEFHKLSPDNFTFYLNAFRYGMPPHGGFGLGIDRLMMQLLGLPIREVVLFPRDRHRLTP